MDNNGSQSSKKPELPTKLKLENTVDTSGMCVVSMCFLVQNRKNGPGQRMGEIANCLAHLADWTKPTAKFHSWFSDIGRPRLKA